METTFGLRGSIIPAGAVGDLTESFKDGPFQLVIANGVIEIGYDDESQTDRAHEVIRQYLDAASFVRRQRLTAHLNQSWRQRPQGGKDFTVSRSDKIHVATDLQVTTTSVTQTGKAFILKAFDSRSLAKQHELVSKAREDTALSSALRYLNEEVVGDDRPLYGIFKALEALTRKLGRDGRARLGALAGQDKDFVADVMQTAQTMRHHADPNAKALLSESECHERARQLIEAYARSLP